MENIYIYAEYVEQRHIEPKQPAQKVVIKLVFI